MEQGLNRFNVFILDNADLEAAMNFTQKLGIDKKDMIIYERLKIDDVRRIKDISTIASDKKQAFIFGNIGFDAQNALLKLLEEYDEFRYFILYKSEDLLDTIKSRAQTVKLDKDIFIDKELLDAIENGDAKSLVTKALKMQNLPKEEIALMLENISKELSYTKFFDKSNTINRELLKFKQFNLNQKLFLFSLFFKLSGGV